MAETIIERFAEIVGRYPEKTALHFFGAAALSSISYQQLNLRARAIAIDLKARGVGRGGIVLIVMRTGIDLVGSFIGAMLIGAVPSVMPAPSPKQLPEVYWAGHRKLFATIRPAAIITDEVTGHAYRTSLPEFADLLSTVRPSGQIAEFRPAELDPGLPAFLQHSSGTTALKKGVVISHRAALEHLDRYAATLGFTDRDVIASWLPLYHDMGLVACLLLPLMAGATVVMIDPFEWLVRPYLLLDAIDRFRATFCWMPNFAFERMATVAPSSPAINLASLKAIINCSEPCKRHSQERFVEHFASAGLSPHAVQVSYAMAENVFAVTQTRLGGPVDTLSLKPSSIGRRMVDLAASGEPAIEAVSCGPTLPQTRIRIVDERRQEVGADRIGEIAIKTATLFDGYYRRPDLAEAALVDGWYYTRDIGFLYAGELYVIGRVDDLLIVRGQNFVAHELEQEIAQVTGVKAGRAVVFTTDSIRSATQELVVLFEPDGTAPGELVRRQIVDRLDAAAGIVPQYVQSVRPGLLRKSSSGKISRAANREWFESELRDSATHQVASAPR